MNANTKVPDVGAQDPERRNSPVADEDDEGFDVLRQEVSGLSSCYFNDELFDDGTYVRSGSGLLRCDAGIWVMAGPADPDNP